MIIDYNRKAGGFDLASLHVNPATTPVEIAERSMRLFAKHCLPRIPA
jgi:hypothetical protein